MNKDKNMILWKSSPITDNYIQTDRYTNMATLQQTESLKNNCYNNKRLFWPI